MESRSGNGKINFISSSSQLKINIDFFVDFKMYFCLTSPVNIKGFLWIFVEIFSLKMKLWNAHAPWMLESFSYWNFNVILSVSHAALFSSLTKNTFPMDIPNCHTFLSDFASISSRFTNFTEKSVDDCTLFQSDGLANHSGIFFNKNRKSVEIKC